MNIMVNLQEYYNNMIQVRESMGYTIGRDYCYIRSFISHCGSNYEDATHIKKEMIDSWILSYNFKKTKTQSNAIGLIRTFCRFINATGGIAYIPDEDYSLPTAKYKPYIFTDEEIRRLFDAIDTSQPHPYAPNREYIFPVLFRMMFCCGMRPNEPLSLKREDVDLVTGEIYIRQSKNNKDRHIVMSPDLLALCCKYDQIIGEREWFFQKWDNGPCCGSWVRIQLDRCWKQTGLSKRCNLRPFDMRHNFATRNIAHWLEAGEDIMGLLPYLSAYMGHSKFTYTLYYIHLLPERLRNCANVDWEKLNVIYGKEIMEDDKDKKSTTI